MTKIKTIATTIGILTIALTLNGYAMMGGGNGQRTYRNPGHSTYYRTDHVVTYNMSPGYYNQGVHMSDGEMADNYSRQYSHDRNRANDNYYHQFRFEYNHRDNTQGDDYNHRQNRTRRYRNER